MSDRIVMIPPHTVLSRMTILAETVDYNHQLMNIPAIWKRTRGAGVRVAILDSGVAPHSDLNPSGYKSFVPGYAGDLNGHGTHCAGVVSAIANNGMGIAGIAPEAENYHAAVLDRTGSGDTREIVAGIRWAVDIVGAHVISMSFGIPAGCQKFPEIEAACDYARSQGVLVVAAAGNEAGGVGQPACYDSVVAVAAVNSMKEAAWFSNKGNEVDFAAGGVDVYSTYLNNGYAKLSGTSMACPALAAVAALVIADGNEKKRMTPEDTIAKLRKIAVDVGPGGYDKAYGYGIPFFNSIDPEQVQAQEAPPVEESSVASEVWAYLDAFSEEARRVAKAGASPERALLAGARKASAVIAERLGKW